MGIGDPFAALRPIGSTTLPFRPIPSLRPIGSAAATSPVAPLRPIGSSAFGSGAVAAGLTPPLPALRLILLPAFAGRQIVVVPTGSRRRVFDVNLRRGRFVPESRRFVPSAVVVFTSPGTFAASAIVPDTPVVPPIARSLEFRTFLSSSFSSSL